MSAISSLFSTTGLYSSYPATSKTGSASPQQDPSATGAAPRSGDVSAAQRDPDTVQNGVSSNSSDSSDSDDTSSSTDNPFVGNSEAAADYDAMIKDLQSGNLTAAQKEFATMQTDLKVHGVHHHRGGTAESASTTSSTTDATSGNLLNVTV